MTEPPNARTRCTPSAVAPADESPGVVTLSHPSTTSTAGAPVPAKTMLVAPSRSKSGADTAARSQRGKVHCIDVADSATAGTDVLPSTHE